MSFIKASSIRRGGLPLLALVLLLTGPVGAAVTEVVPSVAAAPILGIFRANPEFRSAVVEAAVNWAPAVAAPAITASVGETPVATAAREYVTVLKAHETQIGHEALVGALGAGGARALASLKIDPRELTQASDGGWRNWQTRFGRFFDGGAAGAVEVSALIAPFGGRPAPAQQTALARRTSRAPSARKAPPAPATLVFLTDFGIKDLAVAACKLVVDGINAAVKVLDLTHQIPPYNVSLAANFIKNVLPYAKKGTVFVAVVDPGVGSNRKSVAIETHAGHFFVGPDNGLFAEAVAAEGLKRAVELTNTAYHFPGGSATFHGRDIYSPVGAHLASGVPIEKLGPEIKELAPLSDVGPRAVLENGVITGAVNYVEDPFGSVLTNIPRELVERAGWRTGTGLKLEVEIGGIKTTVPYERTFTDVGLQQPLALIHSRGVFSLSINRGHFAERYGVKECDSIVIRAVPAP